MNSHPTKLPKSGILIGSLILAAIIVTGLVPTPNVAGGGGAKMVLVIFLTVIFKATIEYFWSRHQKKKTDKRDDTSAT